LHNEAKYSAKILIVLLIYDVTKNAFYSYGSVILVSSLHLYIFNVSLPNRKIG